MTAKEGNINRDITVFDSSVIASDSPRDDPDLGTPNRLCPGGGPGLGDGGGPGEPFPNCEPLGNLLIIQDPRRPPSPANDSPFGGCFTFEFVNPVDMENLGLLDLEETGVSITVSSWLERLLLNLC